MTTFNWYPHNPRDFLDGVQGLGPDVIGAYIVVLDLIYARGGPAPADYRYLGGLMGCSTRLAERLIQRLVGVGKLRIEGSGILNDRAISEVENQAKRARKLRENGARGGRKTVENRAAANETSGLDNQGLKHKTETKTKTIEGRKEGGARAPESQPQKTLSDEVPPDHHDTLAIAQECARAGGVRFVDPGHIAPGVELIREWQQAGADPPLMIATIREVVAKTKQHRIGSLNFFDGAIRKAVAQQEATRNGHRADSSTSGEPTFGQLAMARLAELEQGGSASLGFGGDGEPRKLGFG